MSKRYMCTQCGKTVGASDGKIHKHFSESMTVCAASNTEVSQHMRVASAAEVTESASSPRELTAEDIKRAADQFRARQRRHFLSMAVDPAVSESPVVWCKTCGHFLRTPDEIEGECPGPQTLVLREPFRVEREPTLAVREGRFGFYGAWRPPPMRRAQGCVVERGGVWLPEIRLEAETTHDFAPKANPSEAARVEEERKSSRRVYWGSMNFMTQTVDVMVTAEGGITYKCAQIPLENGLGGVLQSIMLDQDWNRRCPEYPGGRTGSRRSPR